MKVAHQGDQVPTSNKGDSEQHVPVHQSVKESCAVITLAHVYLLGEIVGLLRLWA